MTKLREKLQRKTMQAINNKFVEKDHQQIIEEHFTAICNKAAENGKLEAYFWFGTEGGLPAGESYTAEELKDFATVHHLDYKPSEYNSPAKLCWK